MKDDEKTKQKSKSNFKNLPKKNQTKKTSAKNSKITKAENDGLYYELVEMTSDWIWSIDKKGRFTYSNSKIKDILGIKPKEVIGKTPVDLMTNDDAKLNKKSFNKILKLHKSFRMVENYFLHKNGEIKTLETNGEPIFDNKGKFNGFKGISRDITELKSAIVSLKKSEEKYRSIVENSLTGIAIIDDKFRLIYANSFFTKIFGYSQKEIIGKRVEKFLDKTCKDFVVDRYKRRQKGEKVPSRYEFNVLRKNGQKCTVEISASIIKNSKGQINTIVQVIDITENKKAEKELKESEEWNKEIFEGSRDAIFIVDKNGGIVDVNQAAELLTGYSKSRLLKMSIPDLHEEEDLEAYKKFFKEIIRGKSVISEARLLRKDGKKIETEFSNKRVIINGVPYMHTVARDVTERKKIEKELQISEARYRGVVENAQVGISITNEDGRLIEWNTALEELTGIPSKNVLGKYIWDVLYKLNAPELHVQYKYRELKKDIINLLKTGKAFYLNETMEKPLIKADGTKIFIEQKISTVKTDKGFLLVSRASDITERKKTEEELKKSEAKFKLLLEELPNAVYLTRCGDKNCGEILFANPAAAKQTGYSIKQLIGMNILTDFGTEKIKVNLKDKRESDLSGDQAISFIEKKKRADGSEYWAKVMITTVDYQNEKVTLSVNSDITEQIEAQEDLKNSEKRYRTLFENNLAGVYISTVDGKILDCNNAVVKMFGFKSKEELLEKNTKDLYRFKIERKIFIEKLKKEGSLENYEAVGRKKDGTLINTLMSVSLLSDKIIQGAIIDITELKKAEETNSKLAAIVEYSNDAIISKNLDGIITSWNKGAEKIYGYSAKEVIGKSIAIILPEGHEEEYKYILKKIKNDELIYNLISKRRTKEGRIIDVSITVSPIKDPEENVVNASTIERDITEIINTENKLKESEHRYKVLFEENLAGVYRSNVEGRILDCNAAFVKMYGYSSKDEILKTNAKEFHLNEKERNYFIERLKEKGSLLNYESTGRKKDGSLIWITENVHMIDSSVLQGTIIDITEKKESEKKVLQLSRGVEQSPEMVIITDVEGKIEYVNPKVCEITGYTKEELIGKNPSIFKSEQTPKEVYKELWETILEGKVWKGELLNKRKYGGLFWENVIIAPIIDNEGNIINFIGIKEDITEKKKIREDLIKAKNKAEEMNKLKSNFLANMSHELRTPMVGILGFSEIIKDNITDGELKEYAELLYDSGSRLLESLNLILNLTKIEADNIEIEKTSVDVITVIKRVVNLFQSEAYKKNLYLNFENENDKLVIETDERMLDQIITNLVNNAVKFTKEGGITVRVNRIRSNQLLEIIIKDTGIGIHKDKQDLIWDEFRQASEGAARLFEGTGLGLTITNDFIKRLGGEILLESDPGKGSTFTVRLPLVGKTDSGEEPEPVVLNDGHEPEINGEEKKLPSILLVDDDNVMRDVTARFLKDICNLDFAADGTEGIEKAANNNYDIILMDINLKSKPGGVQVTNKIRELNGYEDKPIIAVTAYAMSGDKEKYLASGFTNYISKPFTKEDLVGLLEMYIQ